MKLLLFFDKYGFVRNLNRSYRFENILKILKMSKMQRIKL
jgi:hypothetical protein